MKYIWIYFAIISLIAVILTIHDKRAAQQGLWRTKERTLLLVSAFGGSAVMLLAMRLLRHKTRHAKLMVGIPVIIVLQIAAVVLCFWRTIPRL